MKKTILVSAMVLMSLCGFAQTSGSNTKNTVASPETNVNFRLFQTNNRWTFLKLDTRNGVITHVQYSMDGDAVEYPLNNTPLVEDKNQKPGRFFLYPTENSFTFILLDQMDGRVWQVQWNSDREKRGVWFLPFRTYL